MYDFVYVTKSSAKPVKNELIQVIHEVQDIVRPYFTFKLRPVGSASMNMITYDRKSNIGFDFDFDLEINDDENYTPSEIRHIIKNAIDQVAPRYGYKHCENSTRVLTIKKVNTFTSRILHSCDFAIVDRTWTYNLSFKADYATYCVTYTKKGSGIWFYFLESYTEIIVSPSNAGAFNLTSSIIFLTASHTTSENIKQ